MQENNEHEVKIYGAIQCLRVIAWVDEAMHCQEVTATSVRWIL